MPDAKKLTNLLDDISDQLSDQDELSVGDLLDAFGSRAFGPLLAIPGLVALTPLGAVPGAPAVISIFVLLVAGQHVVGLDHPWLPKKLTERSVSKDKWESTRKKVGPWARRVDRFIRPRWKWLTSSVMERAISLISIALAVSMFPLGFLPFAVAVPGAAMLLFGLGLSARDGLVVLLGLLATAGSGYLLFVAIG